MTEAKRSDLPEIGQRVELTEAFESFPLGSWDPGTRGVVAISEQGYIGVKLDRHHPELDEWDNCLMWYGEMEGRTHEEMVEAFWGHVAVSTARLDLPEPGTEVVLKADFEAFPIGIWPAGERGIVAHADDDSIGVRLETHYPVLEEWENCLMFYAAGQGLSRDGMVAEFWDKVEESPAPRPGP